MTKYERACQKRITIAAIILEVLMLVAVFLLGDAAMGVYFNIQTPLAYHMSILTALIAVGVLQYMILTIELIARHREDRRGFTIPIAFLPGGTMVRALIMLISNVVVMCLKMVIYFISVMLSFGFQICRLDKVLGTAHLVDMADHMLEPIEIAVNKLYNLLYYHKIKPNTCIFTSIFNSSLSFWCINH
ncbi:MAG: hypothetical protein J6S69_03820 [Proteobacteria bacterium]|nr:hypothetical protein [Pseudomonadota bacterium]